MQDQFDYLFNCCAIICTEKGHRRYTKDYQFFLPLLALKNSCVECDLIFPTKGNVGPLKYRISWIHRREIFVRSDVRWRRIEIEETSRGDSLLQRINRKRGTSLLDCTARGQIFVLGDEICATQLDQTARRVLFEEANRRFHGGYEGIQPSRWNTRNVIAIGK